MKFSQGILNPPRGTFFETPEEIIDHIQKGGEMILNDKENNIYKRAVTRRDFAPGAQFLCYSSRNREKSFTTQYKVEVLMFYSIHVVDGVIDHETIIPMNLKDLPTFFERYEVINDFGIYCLEMEVTKNGKNKRHFLLTGTTKPQALRTLSGILNEGINNEK